MSLPTNITIEGFLDYLNGVYPTPDATITDESESDLQARVLMTAYNQLGGVYDLGAAPVASMQFAVYAQALFVYKEGESMARRSNLRAQGVTEAGIVKEKYAGSGLPVCPEAASVLADYGSVTPLASVQRTRDRYEEYYD